MDNKIICPHASLCGGCTYQDISYEEQLNIKESAVRELMSAYANDTVWEEAVKSPLIYGYRNKMEYSFGDMTKDGPLTLGLHQRKSFYNVITTDDCNIVDEDYRLILKTTLDFFANKGISYYHKKRHTGTLRHLVIRKAQSTGELLIMLVSTNELLEDITKEYAEKITKLMEEGKLKGSIAGILHLVNDLPADTVQAQQINTLYGRTYFYEELLGLRFKITPFSFFQTNTFGAELLYKVVREYCGNVAGQKIFDLYSGTGTIAQMLAASADAGEVTGVEIVEEAVEAARENAALNKLDNCKFIAGDVYKVLDNAAETLGLPDFIVLDPPREGMTPKALAKIISYEVPHIVYVSCKPSSLARDMESFDYRGYHIEKIRCVDMFPWTKNIECVCLLSRIKE